VAIGVAFVELPPVGEIEALFTAVDVDIDRHRESSLPHPISLPRPLL
jgi:hypothetical protein